MGWHVSVFEAHLLGTLKTTTKDSNTASELSLRLSQPVVESGPGLVKNTRKSHTSLVGVTASPMVWCLRAPTAELSPIFHKYI